MDVFIKDIFNFLTALLPDLSVEKIDSETSVLISLNTKLCIITSDLFSQPIDEFIINKRKELLYNYRKQNFETFVIWIDQWESKRAIIKSRIRNKIKVNKKIYARQCSVVNITKVEAKDFLEENHLHGFFKAKFQLGLIYNNQLVALSTFGPIKIMTDPNRSTSSELLQFTTLPNFTIIGGLSKLIKHFLTRNEVGDLVTSIPIEWASGSSFMKVGFCKLDQSKPLLFLSNNTLRNKNKFTPNAFDLGNLKLIMK